MSHQRIVLDPEVAAVFPDAESANQALKNLIAIAHRAGARKRRANSRPRAHRTDAVHRLARSPRQGHYRHRDSLRGDLSLKSIGSLEKRREIQPMEDEHQQAQQPRARPRLCT